MGKKVANILKGELVSSIFYILLGLCLAFMPVQTVNIICKVVFGLVLIGAGLYHIYIYIREKEDSTILDLFSGVIVLVLGGFLFFNPQIVVKLLPLLLGALVLVDSIWTFRGSFRLKKRGRREWKAFLISSFVCIGFGIAMMVNPFPKVRQTVMFAGWVFLCNGVADIVFFILLRRGMKKEPNMQKQGSTDETENGQQTVQQEQTTMDKEAEASEVSQEGMPQEDVLQNAAPQIFIPEEELVQEPMQDSSQGSMQDSAQKFSPVPEQEPVQEAEPEEEVLEEWKD